MNNHYQSYFWPETPVSEYTIFPILERLFKKPLTDEMRQKFRHCNTLESFIDTVCHDHLTQALIAGDGGLGTLTEIYICLRADLAWDPRDGLDGWGAKLDDTLEVKGIRIQVRHSKNFRAHHWQFLTQDSLQKRRYEILACVGYHLPQKFGDRSPNFLNPLQSDVFLIPTEDIDDIGTINISRDKFRTNNIARLNKWWDYHIADHEEIEAIVTKIAHGKPIRLDSHMSFLDELMD